MSVQSFIMLGRLTERDGETIEDILRRVVDKLRGLEVEEEATVELRLIRDRIAGGRSIYSVQLTRTGAVLQTKRATGPKLVLITNAKTFLDLVKSEYSPVQAY